MDIKQSIAKLATGQDLTTAEMQSTMHFIMSGKATPAQIGGFLIGLRAKGENVNEIAAAAKVMRQFSTKVSVEHPHLVDIVGTGGDNSNTFNISTTSAFVIAAAGGAVAKGNNRSVSSNCGSADVLEAAGVVLELTPQQVAQCIDELGVGFMFAPVYHSAMKHALGPRRELGTRTVFNLLGPLINPAEVPNQLVGVFSDEWLVPFAEILQQLGCKHVLVVHSEDGMDEISIFAPTNITELKNNEITSYRITPEQFDMKPDDHTPVTINDAASSLKIMQAVLDDRPGPARDIVLLNAGAAIYCAGLVANIETGIDKAIEVIASGAAKQKLEALITLTNQLKGTL